MSAPGRWERRIPRGFWFLPPLFRYPTISRFAYFSFEKTFSFLLLDWFPTKDFSGRIYRARILLRAPDSFLLIYVPSRIAFFVWKENPPRGIESWQQQATRSTIFPHIIFRQDFRCSDERVSRSSHMIMWFKSVSHRICSEGFKLSLTKLKLPSLPFNSLLCHSAFCSSTRTAKCSKEDFQGGNKDSAGHFGSSSAGLGFLNIQRGIQQCETAKTCFLYLTSGRWVAFLWPHHHKRTHI